MKKQRLDYNKKKGISGNVQTQVVHDERKQKGVASNSNGDGSRKGSYFNAADIGRGEMQVFTDDGEKGKDGEETG
ncbi:hypothetical protein L2E82_15399 [Cichorium intybus]|uniref:Uncharacterized protein n=1 Tax=Cichorium intybus TaxID=13427 RepID=A0ACB9F2P0_CICIN|nr:hypothetical protein L2E82_15399 [Cichorium intybus]